MRALLLSLTSLLALGACKLEVDYTGTYYQCNPDGACPDGYECQDMVCIPTDPEPPACSTDVAAGGGHACAIRDGGAVWCWGRNDKGQLGDGTATDSDVPVQVVGVSNAIRVGAGESFSCALDSGGVVHCWGANESGELGDGTMGDSRAPVQVAGVTNATQLAVGTNHSCVILADDSVSCWGANEAGQIGDGSTSTRLLPTAVAQLPPSRSITAGYFHTCAVDTTGTARCWGENDNGELGVGDTETHNTPTAVVDIAGITSIAAGDDVTCAVAEGFAHCWGENDNGQLGNTAAGGGSDRPVPVTTPVPLLSLRAGDEHVCGADRQGDLYCWGYGADGRLGDGQVSSRGTATLSLFKQTISFALGGEHTCAVDYRGAIRCAGFNRRGALGDGRRVTRGEPTTLAGINNAVDIVAGGNHTCASLMDGKVMCWGQNNAGQVGDGGFSEVRTLPSEVFGLRNITQLVAGSSHTCANTPDGVYCWGNNDDSRIGDPSNQPSAQPRKVDGIPAAKTITAGDFSTCAISMTNEPLCWGNVWGNWPPENPMGITSASDVAAGQDFRCVQELNGPVQCSGTNYTGSLGDGTLDNLGQTSMPANLGTVVDIQARGRSACAVASDGTAKCWGLNDSRLGTGGGYATPNPTAIMGLTGIAQLSLGWEASCARKTDGTVWCWGPNPFGQTGDNTYIDRNVPVQIAGLSGATDIAAGRNHVCAVKADATVACWGLDTTGQLGLGIRQIIRPVGVRMTCD